MENVYFLISLATIIEPEYYKAEFKLVKKLLNEFIELYPEISENDLKTFIIFSYQAHSEPLCYKKRREYLKIIFLLSYYEDINGTYISEYPLEIKMRKQFCRIHTNRKLSKRIKTAIAEITYFSYVEQLKAERKLLLTFPAMTIKQ